MRKLVLTEEGEYCRKHGLPEVRLYEALAKEMERRKQEMVGKLVKLLKSKESYSPEDAREAGLTEEEFGMCMEDLKKAGWVK